MPALKNLVLFFLSLLLPLFSVVQAHTVESPTESGVIKKEVNEVIEPIVVRVTGYGAYAKKEDASSEPKRLMAIRASKLDAYRTLAERLYGIAISGSSTVNEFVLKDDGYATAVDSFVRGAKVVSIIENKERGFETVLEVLLPGDFQDCLNKVNNFKFGVDCLRPLSTMGMTDLPSTRSASPTMQSVYYLK